MKDIDKILEQEYLINDVYKLIVETLNERNVRIQSNPEDLIDNSQFYKVAIDKFTSAPSEEDTRRIDSKTYADVFEFEAGDDLRTRIAKINKTYTMRVKDRTIPRIMNYLDVLTTMYKIFNHYNDSAAGFFMEHLSSILLGGKIPEGNPIEDVVVEEGGSIKKAYSLKSYGSKGDLGGSFQNLAKFFKDNPDITHISYILISKSSTDKKVSSIEFKEVWLTPYDTQRDRSKHAKVMSILDAVYNIDKVVDMEGRNIAYQRAEALRESILIEFSGKNKKHQNSILSILDEVGKDKNYKKVEIRKEFHSLFIAGEITDFMLLKKINLSGLQQSVKSIINNQGMSPQEKTQSIKNLYSSFIDTGKLNGKAGMTENETQFKMKQNIFDNSTGKYNLEITNEHMIRILDNNSKLIGEIVKQAYLTLDQINDGVNGFFRGSMEAQKAINQTNKSSNDMVELSSNFKNIIGDVEKIKKGQ